jgi:TonB family protein
MRFLFALILCAATIAASPPQRRAADKSGCDPVGLRLRLENVQSLAVSRACGNISHPWAYRGPIGRELAMRSYGRHQADSLFAKRMVHALIEDALVDTVTEAPSTRVECDPTAAKPMYLLEFHFVKQSTYAVLWFELGVALFFDADQPLGMVPLGARADSVWSMLAELLYDDPLLRKERPPSPQGAALMSMRGDYVLVDQLPDALLRVPPKYPFTAQELGISGRVMVEAKVGPDGMVEDAYVVEGHRLLRDEALKAVWQWRFDPAKFKGEPVAAWVAVPVTFTLN